MTRPAALTAFGGEWVQLFPKDSWENTTNEYEPYTFNHYGAKIPLPELRSTPTGLRDEPADTGLEAVDGTGLSQQSADGTETEMGSNAVTPYGTTSASLDAATKTCTKQKSVVEDIAAVTTLFGIYFLNNSFPSTRI